jgi:hypothetical protein
MGFLAHIFDFFLSLFGIFHNRKKKKHLLKSSMNRGTEKNTRIFPVLQGFFPLKTNPGSLSLLGRYVARR